MKSLVTLLALAGLVVVLFMQLDSEDLGGRGLPVQGTAQEAGARGTAAPGAARATEGEPAAAVDRRRDAAPRAEERSGAEPPVEPSEVDTRFFGRVVAAEDGTPIPRAEVRVETPSSVASLEGRAREFELTGEPRTTSDPDGRFELRVPSNGTQLAILSAEGRAPTRVELNGGHFTPERSCEVRLSRAARLSGVVIDSRGETEPLIVELEASTDWMMDSPGLERVGGASVWIAEVDSGGSFSFECLPPSWPLRVTVLAQREVAMRMPTPLTLEPGEHREVEWHLGFGAMVHGTVLDENDIPLPNVALWLVPASEVRGTYLPAHVEPTRCVTSDAQGFFCFTDLAAGDWVIGPAPEQERVGAGVRVKPAPDEPPSEIVIRASRGGYLSGHVLDPDGGGAAGIFVSVYGLEGGGWSSARSEEGGAFRVGPVLPGRYRLRATPLGGHSSFAAPEEVVAHTDDPEIVLRLTRGGVVAGRVIDAHTGQPVPATIAIHGVEGNSHRMIPLREEGDFTFGGLPPGNYQLVGKSEDGRVGLLREVRVEAGALLEGLEIPVDRGGQLRVRYQGPEEYATIHIEWDGVSFEHDTLRTGMEKTVPLPLGEVLVRLQGHDRSSSELPPPLLFEREQRIEVVPDEVREVVFVIE